MVKEPAEGGERREDHHLFLHPLSCPGKKGERRKMWFSTSTLTDVPNIFRVVVLRGEGGGGRRRAVTITTVTGPFTEKGEKGEDGR